MTNNSTTATGVLVSVVLGRRIDLVNDPITVGDYISDFGSRLHARRFGEVDDGEGNLALHGQNGEERLTLEGDWLLRFKRSGRRGMVNFRTFSAATDMNFLRFREEEAYELLLKLQVGELVDTIVTTDLVIVRADNFSKVVFNPPFDTLWFIIRHRYCAKYQDFEMHLRSRSVRTLGFAGWN